MIVSELFQDELNRVPYSPPQFALSVGGATKSATNPTVVAWSGVNVSVLEGPGYSVSVVKKHADPKKVGTHVKFLGTFRTENQEPVNHGSLGECFEPTLIARFSLTGDLNRWRSKSLGGSNNGVGNYDGNIFADSSESFSEDAHWYYQLFGNAPYSPNPIPSPWPPPV